MHYLRELKEEGSLIIQHVSGEENEADIIFTKNASVKIFERHIPKLVGRDEYMRSDDDGLN